MKAYLFGSAQNPHSTGTRYAGVSQVNIAWQVSTGAYNNIIPHSTTLSEFRVQLQSAPGSGRSLTFNIRKNGVNTDLSVTISGTDTIGVNTTDSVSFDAGDIINLRCVPSGTPTVSHVSWSVLQTSTNDSFIAAGGTSNSLYSASNFLYFGTDSTPFTVSSRRTTVMPMAGVVKNFHVRRIDETATSPTITIVKNTVDTDVAVTIPSNEREGINTTDSFSFVAGDEIYIKTSASIDSRLYYMATVEPAIAGQSWLITNDPNNGSGTLYNSPTRRVVWNATESNVHAPLPPMVIKNMYTRRVPGQTSGNGWQFTLRKNAADTALVNTVTGGTTIDGATADVSSNGTDLFSVKGVAVGSPSTSDNDHTNSYTLEVETASASETLSTDLWQPETVGFVTETETHSTDTLTKESLEATHSTDSLVVAPDTSTHSIDSLVIEQQQTTQQTDTFIQDEASHSHDTDTLLIASQASVHSADTLVSQSLGSEHHTDTNIVESASLEHSSDTQIIDSQTSAHSTDTYVSDGLDTSHNTDTLLVATQDSSQTTDTLVGERLTETHATDTYVKQSEDSDHTTDSNVYEVASKFHQTDIFVYAKEQVEQSTDSLVIEQQTTSQSLDTFVQDGTSVSFNTDTLVIAEASQSQQTDTVVSEVESVEHSTDTLLSGSEQAEQATDTLVRATQQSEQQTDTLVKDDSSNNHNTDTLVLDKATSDHSTDTLLVDKSQSDHATDTFIDEPSTITHATDSNVVESEAKGHSTSTFVFDPAAPIPERPEELILLVNGQIQVGIIL